MPTLSVVRLERILLVELLYSQLWQVLGREFDLVQHDSQQLVPVEAEKRALTGEARIDDVSVEVDHIVLGGTHSRLERS